MPKRKSEREIEVTLRALRAEQEMTQVDVAKKSGIVQGEVSVLEKRDAWDGVRIGTLRRYLDALGFELELVAVAGDMRVRLGPAKD